VWRTDKKQYTVTHKGKTSERRTKILKFVEDHPMNIHVQFGFNHICSFWEEGIWTFSHRFTFQASSPKPMGQLEPNFARMFLGWSSTKLLFFVTVMLIYVLWWWPSWISDRHKKQKVGKGHSNDHSFTVWVQSVH
jgi:hypothetical protein